MDDWDIIEERKKQAYLKELRKNAQEDGIDKVVELTPRQKAAIGAGFDPTKNDSQDMTIIDPDTQTVTTKYKQDSQPMNGSSWTQDDSIVKEIQKNMESDPTLDMIQAGIKPDQEENRYKAKQYLEYMKQTNPERFQKLMQMFPKK